ncbi:hypothetical protein K402DRAFT_418686 [Aulographum hederae CBS 113979]|uniref:Uncharacterized protein n=1 Tax=Aulographum hederae CBS 113979 TaxID=1176131 RepID=A0A6G1H853_9PEZI|nr:hypothetical protein K402DRAFT_418686 [Aulographum hederae CBS 113979]
MAPNMRSLKRYPDTIIHYIRDFVFEEDDIQRTYSGHLPNSYPRRALFPRAALSQPNPSSAAPSTTGGTSNSHSDRNLIIVLASALGAFFIAAIIVTICICRRVRRKRADKSINPFRGRTATPLAEEEFESWRKPSMQTIRPAGLSFDDMPAHPSPVASLPDRSSKISYIEELKSHDFTRYSSTAPTIRGSYRSSGRLSGKSSARPSISPSIASDHWNQSGRLSSRSSRPSMTHEYQESEGLRSGRNSGRPSMSIEPREKGNASNRPSLSHERGRDSVRSTRNSARPSLEAAPLAGRRSLQQDRSRASTDRVRASIDEPQPRKSTSSLRSVQDRPPTPYSLLAYSMPATPIEEEGPCPHSKKAEPILSTSPPMDHGYFDTTQAPAHTSPFLHAAEQEGSTPIAPSTTLEPSAAARPQTSDGKPTHSTQNSKSSSYYFDFEFGTTDEASSIDSFDPDSVKKQRRHSNA